jgi:hypothetical protein
MTMINEEKLNLSCEDPTVASVTLSGMLFDRFMKDNEEDLKDEYLDYLNENKDSKEDIVGYPFYCYAVFNKLVVESYFEALEENGLRSDS